MTFKIGDKVRINDNYCDHLTEPDESVTESRGTEATVLEVDDSYVEIEQTVEQNPNWSGTFMLYHRELDKL